MAAHIGIVGCSAPGAALCFQTICANAPRYLGPDVHPEVSMHVLSFADHVRHVRAADWAALGEMLLTSTRRLQAAGADFVVCPDNTAHLAYDCIASRVPLPWLHIADAMANEAERRRYRRIAVLGTRPLVESGLYDTPFARLGAAAVLPTVDERAALDALIFGELTRGVVSAFGRDLLRSLCRRLESQGCDAVALACTELPLLVDPDSPPVLPILDSARTLADAAIRRAIGAASAGSPSCAVP
jgi:aspartate racemase